MVNKNLNHLVFEALNNQLNANDPPIVGETLDRLKLAGYSESEAKDKIAAVLIGEIYDVMKNKEPYNNERYTLNLNALK